MIAWLLKNWKLFIDIVIVVAAIVLFSMLDPFGVFSKRSLKSTATILSGVKSIGELVTAEYYGEVISSLHGTQVYDLKPDVVYQDFEDCIIEIKSKIVVDVLKELGDKSELSNKQIRKLTKAAARDDYFITISNTYNKNNIYPHLITFLCVKKIRDKTSAFYKRKSNNPLKDKANEQIADKLLKETLQYLEKLSDADEAINYAAFSEYIYSLPPYFDEIIDFHYNLNEGEIKKPKHDIVFIGRGWVKAGFKFDQLNKRNFYYDEQNHTIHFYGLSPEILDNDINPWFIPEKRVKGFELVDFYQKATFEEAKTVKIRCKQELLDQARNAGILAQAKINGAESLQSFFALLTDTPDLKVRFHDIPYKSELNYIKEDTLITLKEALWLDSIIISENKNIEDAEYSKKEYFSKRLGIFLSQLDGLNFIKEGVTFNYFMPKTARILDHKRFITPKDTSEIYALRKPIIVKGSDENKTLTTAYFDSIYYGSSYPDFARKFNYMIDFLEKQISENDKFREDTMTVNQSQLIALNLTKADFNFDTIPYPGNPDSIHFMRVVYKTTDRKFKFNNNKYPIFPALDTLIERADGSYDNFCSHLDSISRQIEKDGYNQEELKTITAFYKSEMKNETQRRSAKKVAEVVQKLFGKN